MAQTDIKADIKNRPRVFLNAKEEKEIQQGFPWVFDNEIDFIKFQDEKQNAIQASFKECTILDGSIVDVFSKGGIFLGSGVLNKKSKIAIRILSREKYTEYDYEFFKSRIKSAYDLRFLYYKKNDSYRLIFGEADLLPGLITERYVDTENRSFLVVQFLSLAVEIFRSEIIRALTEVCHPFAIYERSDVDVREKEGLPLVKGWIGNDFFSHDSFSHDTTITIKENGVLLNVDIENGQKTGYFLDQKFNRRRVSELARGKTVLDACTHTGAFGLNAVLGGAKKVVSVDISEDAIKVVNENIALNGAKKVMSAVCADVFDYLRKLDEEKGNGVSSKADFATVGPASGDESNAFDFIILDPPAFAKSAKSIEKAYGGYKEINMRAMKILPKGGILVTCSCSHFMEETMFLDMLMHAARDAGKSLQILEISGAGPDHPVLAGYPKSRYLKCVIARVM